MNPVSGKIITIGKEEYELPPLPLIKFKSVSVFLGDGDLLSSENKVDALIDGIFWSLRRNYPDISRDLIADGLDLVNYSLIVSAFVEVNELIPADELGK